MSHPEGAGAKPEFLRGATIAFVTATLFALVFLLVNDGYGRADLAGYLVFSLFFAVVIGVMGSAFGEWAEGSWWRVSVAWVIGAVVGVVCIILFALLGQAVAGAMSLPLGPAWLMGGGFGVALAKQRLGATRTVDLGVVGVLLLTGVLMFDPVWFFLTGAQRLETEYFEQLDAEGPLTLVRSNGATTALEDWRIDDPETVDLLTGAGITGTVRRTGFGTNGAGPSVRFLVVFSGPVTKKVELRQPKGADAVYVQAGESFVIFPPLVRTRDDLVILEPGESPDRVHVWIESQRGMSGSSVLLKSFSHEPR